MNKSVPTDAEKNTSEPLGYSLDYALFSQSRGGDADVSDRGDTITLDGAKLINQIALLPSSQWPWGVPQEIRTQVLCFHPEPHCTYGIDVRTQKNGWHRLIGKVYVTDHQGVFQVMEGLRRAGFGSEEEFSIPRPLAYIPSLYLLLQERVDGTTAREIFKLGDGPQCAAAAERCGRWLGRFQKLARKSGQISGMERFLGSAERKCRLMTEAESSWVVKCEKLFEQLRAGALSLDTNLTCAGHGDFCEHQIVLQNGQTVVLDWDLYDIAHPARDVAKFIVSLERLAMRHLGSVRSLDGAAEVFLSAYLESGGHPYVPAALPFFKGVFWLKGRTKAIQSRTVGWHEEAEIMLDESFRSCRMISRK